MNFWDEQRAIAERLVAVMEQDFKHEMYEHNLEETVRGLMQKLAERDAEISRLRQSLPREEV